MDGLRGFLKGLVAANGDNEYIYVDGIARIAGKKLDELGNIFDAMEKLEKEMIMAEEQKREEILKEETKKKEENKKLEIKELKVKEIEL